MTRFDYIKTLPPEAFVSFMHSDASSVCHHNANGRRWVELCKVKYANDCAGCYRNFWIEEDIGETWNGFHGQITAPKGTFERIFNDEDDDIDI